jgi:hypothetical protein
MSNKMYDILKWIAQYLLPGLGTLYFALAKIWGLPYGVEIVGTISAFDAFLGGLLGISSANYYSEQVQTNVNNDSQDELIEEGVVENED